MSSGALQTLLLAVACTLAPGLAEAGIYKCTGPDGNTRYTSDPSHCPNAERQVLKKRVQKVIEKDAPLFQFRSVYKSINHNCSFPLLIDKEIIDKRTSHEVVF